MAAYERVTLNRGGRNSRFDCITIIKKLSGALATCSFPLNSFIIVIYDL